MNLNLYLNTKKDIQDLILKQKGVDIIEAFSLVAVATHTPAIVCAFYIGEITGWPQEILDNIQTLIKTYGYINIEGIPESYPGKKI